MVLCLCHFFLRSLLKAPRLELLWRSQNRFSKYGTFLRPQNGWSTGFKGPKFHTLTLEDLTFPKMDGNHLRALAFWMRKCLAFFKPRAKLRERLGSRGLCTAIGIKPEGIKIYQDCIKCIKHHKTNFKCQVLLRFQENQLPKDFCFQGRSSQSRHCHVDWQVSNGHCQAKSYQRWLS